RLDMGEWRVRIAELYILDLQPEAAVRNFGWALITLPPSRGPAGYSSSRYRVMMGLGRAHAEAGRYDQALTWLQRAQPEFWSRCGEGAEAQRMRVHLLRE